MKLLIGLILIAFGTAIIYYRFKIYDITGEWNWASLYLGNTMNAIVLMGMILIGIGAAYPFGAFDDFNTVPTAVQKP
ncbi:hypothetical protein K2X92_01685 [Candidatus Gracilibacteria bacterium]|nr:hypothetical protein [Candidatus Gracilibacteria bacterium]